MLPRRCGVQGCLVTGGAPPLGTVEGMQRVARSRGRCCISWSQCVPAVPVRVVEDLPPMRRTAARLAIRPCPFSGLCN